MIPVGSNILSLIKAIYVNNLKVYFILAKYDPLSYLSLLFSVSFNTNYTEIESLPLRAL